MNVTYGQSARKYPESSGLNAAGHPIIHQLDNVGEQSIVPSSRMSSQAMQPQQLKAHYPSAFPGPLAGPSTFPGSNTFPGFSAFPSPSAFSGPSTFSGPGLIYPVPSAVDTFLGPTLNYPFHVGIYYSVFGSTCLPNHSYIAVYFPLVLLQ